MSGVTPHRRAPPPPLPKSSTTPSPRPPPRPPSRPQSSLPPPVNRAKKRPPVPLVASSSSPGSVVSLCVPVVFDGVDVVKVGGFNQTFRTRCTITPNKSQVFETSETTTHTIKQATLTLEGYFSVNLSAEYPTYRGGEEREKEKAWGEEFGRTGGVESGGRGKGKEEGYCFLSNGAFWAVYVPLERREQFEEILDELTTFQEYPLEEDEKIETDRSRTLKKTSSHIDKAGETVARGILSVGQGTSKASRSANQAYIKRADSGTRQMTEEERRKTEHDVQRSKKMQGTTSKVTGAISSGATAVGTGLSRGGHFAKSKYDKTDYAKKKEREKEEQGPERADSSASFEVVKTTGRAITTVASSVKVASVGMATDARDCSVERTLHTEGEEAAELRRKNWEANAHYAFAGVDGVRLFSYTNVGMLELGTKMGVKVGIAAAEYNALKKNVLFGGMYKAGFVSYRSDVLEGWVDRWCVLRPMSIAFYDHAADKFSHPVAYHQIWKIKKVKKSNFHVVKRQFGIELMCRGKVDYFSLQLDNPKDTNAEKEQEEWISCIESLQYFNLALK